MATKKTEKKPFWRRSTKIAAGVAGTLAAGGITYKVFKALATKAVDKAAA